jgi:hypothetical protein
MSILLIMGSTPRHVFMARAVARSGRLKGIIVEIRGWRPPAPPPGLPAHTLALFEQHFAGRAAAEALESDPQVQRIYLGLKDEVAAGRLPS